MRQVGIKVTGKVQGVFFRFNTKKKANELGLVGWVKNENDGSVYIIAEGEDKDVKELIDWCHIGSPWSKVSKVEVTEESEKIDTEGFEVR